MAGGELAPSSGPSEALKKHFRSRRSFWGEFFASCDQAGVSKHKKDALDELDSLWSSLGFMGKEFLVGGYGFWSKIVEFEEGKEPENTAAVYPKQGIAIVEQCGPIEFLRGYSEGFNVTEFEEEDNPSLSYQFKLNTHLNFVASTLRGNQQPLMQVKLGTLSIAPVERIDQLEARLVPYCHLN